MTRKQPPQDNNRTFWRPTGASAYAIALVALPGFLLGAFAPEIKEDLSFGDTELGAILTFGYLISSIVMSISGGAADRTGPKRVLRYGVTIASLAAFLTGFLGNTFFLLMIFIGLNRVAEGIIHPATNPEEAKEGTIRKLMAQNVQENSVHGSDSNDNALKEINFFFNDDEIVG